MAQRLRPRALLLSRFLLRDGLAAGDLRFLRLVACLALVLHRLLLLAFGAKPLAFRDLALPLRDLRLCFGAAALLLRDVALAIRREARLLGAPFLFFGT